MNTRVKSTAILMAFILTLSVFTSVAATTAVAAATMTTTTTTTISADNTNPTVGSAVTLSVSVKAGATILTNKQVTVTHTYPGGTTPDKDGVFDTGSTGTKTFSSGTYSSAGQRVYTATFAGDSQYASSSGTVTVNVGSTATKTNATISASTTTPTVGQSVTFTVNLKSGSTGLDNKPVKIWCTFNGYRIDRGTFNTVNGVYSFEGPFSRRGQVIYHAEFAGDSQYTSSSGTVTVNVGSTATTATTISASNTNPPVKQPVTFTVNLKSGSTGLSKPVKIWCTFNGYRIDRGTFNTVNGVYSFEGPFSRRGQVIYHAEFAGDSTYRASSGTVTVNVKAR